MDVSSLLMDHLLGGMNVALLTREPFVVPPLPPSKPTLREVENLASAFLAAVGPVLYACKATGRMHEFKEQTNDPQKAGVILSFPSAAALHGVMSRMANGEVVDPTAPLPGHERGVMATYCGADGGYSARVYSVARSCAERRGKTFEEVVVVVCTHYTDESGAAQSLESVLTGPAY